MNQLLIATSNRAKLEEYKKLLGDFGVPLVDLGEIGIRQKVEETGKTFEENALIKAREYCRLSSLTTIADDGGFEIDALNGEPGIYSHRWLGYEADDEKLINAVYEKLEGVAPEKRTARIRSILAVVTPNGQKWTINEAIEGIVPDHASSNRKKGFPFRSVLFIPQFNKFYIDLAEHEQAEINQRARAVKKALPILKNIFEG